VRTLGIDPGGTTGFCLIEDSMVVDDAEIEFDDLLTDEYMDEFIYRSNRVAIERFFLTARSVKLSRQPEALYVTGIAMYLASRLRIPVTLQSAADAKSAFTNEHLREMGLFRAVTGPHARDALRHALLAERRMKLA
jgi:hypothetical protein